jgi:alpha-beta hydrolase superfamily lysophospholipase
MHGGDDNITSALATKQFFGRVTGEVTHREWPGLFHEIHNEPEKEQVFEFTLAWMKQF